jgi:hypothetical protein
MILATEIAQPDDRAGVHPGDDGIDLLKHPDLYIEKVLEV